MSLPPRADSFSSPCVQFLSRAAGRPAQPKSDRRTTQGIFHIVEGGLPVPADKIAVPSRPSPRCWAAALRPPRGSARRCRSRRTRKSRSHCFVSLLLRPLVCPAAGSDPRRPWRSASSRPAAWSAIWISSRASSATPAIPICPKTMPRWTRCTGPATPAASSWRRTWSA